MVHCEFGSFNCFFSHASAKHYAKSDILSSYTFQFFSPVMEIQSLQWAVHAISRRDEWQSIDLLCDKTSAAWYLFLVYFYHSFINANLHHFYAALFYFDAKRKTFHFKKWHIKTHWLCLRMEEIMFPRTWNFKIFQRRMPPDPPFIKPFCF